MVKVYLQRGRILTLMVVAIGALVNTAKVSAQWQPPNATSGPVYYTGGNVGIGVTSPQVLLDVASAVGGPIGRFYNSSTDGGVGYALTPVLAVSSKSNGSFTAGHSIFAVGRDETSSGVFNISATFFSVLGTGQVGIGTTMPGLAPGGSPSSTVSRLEVAGNIRAHGQSTVSTGELDSLQFLKCHTLGCGSGSYSQGEIRSYTSNGYAGGLRIYASVHTGGGNYNVVPAMTIGSVVSDIGNTNVGIGTTTPNDILEIYGNDKYVRRTLQATSSYGGYDFYENTTRKATVQYLGSNYTDSTRRGDLELSSINNDLTLQPFGGNVGVGTTVPVVKLHVVGDATVTGTVSGGNIVAKYQDVAEWVPASQQFPPGTVVTLDPEVPNKVVASSQAYDTTVAGVISQQPGLLLGEDGEGKVKVATTGRVKVKVDATMKPIRIGDLLVTSAKPGLAMRSEPVRIEGSEIHRPGTLLGKALEPLQNGVGEILVLMSLQ